MNSIRPTSLMVVVNIHEEDGISEWAGEMSGCELLQNDMLESTFKAKLGI